MRWLSSQRAAASIALLIGLHASAALAFSGGIDSTFFGLTGCPLCHFGGTAPTVVLSGPTTVAPGETVDYTLTIFGNSAQNYGGFNVAAPLGTLSVGGPFSAGTTNLVGAGGLDEITHFMPKQGDFLNTIEFSFSWTAPPAFNSVTLRGWGNAVNFNHSPSGDMASLSTLQVFSTTADTPTPTDTPTATPTPGGSTPGICADAVPLHPALVIDPAAQGCQAAIAKAGALYMKKDLKAVRHCLATFAAGSAAGDPLAQCVGTAEALPSDAATAAAIGKAQAKAAALLLAKCTDAAVLPLDVCADTESGLETCLLQQHRQHVVDAIAAEFGTVALSADKGELKCQKAIGDAAGGYLTAQLRASQKCLVKRNKTGLTADGAALCIGAIAGGAFMPPVDTKTATAASDAEAKLAKKIQDKCSDAQIAALDACGDDQASVLACLLCSHRTSTFAVLSDEFGGTP